MLSERPIEKWAKLVQSDMQHNSEIMLLRFEMLNNEQIIRAKKMGYSYEGIKFILSTDVASVENLIEKTSQTAFLNKFFLSELKKKLKYKDISEHAIKKVKNRYHKISDNFKD
jgi:hypothetical protein